jgi:galactosylceramidase
VPLQIAFSSEMLGMRFDGIGGLAAVGGARLLYEYAEPTRAKILDLLFDPSAGGAFYHMLKVEIEGDIDSSYGSGPSFQHTADPASVSFNRGIYLPWLIKEAKRRQPEIKLYALRFARRFSAASAFDVNAYLLPSALSPAYSWGLPHWVGNDSTDGVLSSQGVKYHTDYLAGAKAEHGISFDYIGKLNHANSCRHTVHSRWNLIRLCRDLERKSLDP